MELDGEQGPISLGGAKERRLLAALALHAGTVVPGSALVDALWADRPPRTAEKTLQNYVLRVRRSLRRCEGFTVTTRPPGYQLDAAPGVIDACAVEDLIGRGTQARLAGDEAGAVRLLRTALAYWRGPSLGEFASEPFARSEAARLEELRAAAEEDLVAAELALGRHHELIGRLESMVATLPLRERRWALVMVAL
jgi:DNA-binding SARP family transcriptional activator